MKKSDPKTALSIYRILLRLSLNIDCDILADAKAPYIINCYSNVTSCIVCRVNRFNFNITFKTLLTLCSILDFFNFQYFIIFRSYSDLAISIFDPAINATTILRSI